MNKVTFFTITDFEQGSSLQMKGVLRWIWICTGQSHVKQALDSGKYPMEYAIIENSAVLI